MCKVGSVVGKITNPLFGGGPDTGAASAGMGMYDAAAANALNQLTSRSGTEFNEAQEEYKAQAPLRAQQIEEGTLTPAKIEGARARGMADVATAYEGARANQMRANAAMGVNPGDPAAAAGSNAASARLAAAEAGAGNVAALNERTYRTNIASGVTARQVPTVGGANSALAAGASGLGNLGGQQASLLASQQQQQTSLIPSFSIKRGGRVRAWGVRRMRPTGPRPTIRAARGGVADPPRYGMLRHTPLMKRSDGRVLPTHAAPAEGHITGPGTETSDEVPARLSHDEYVYPAFATKTYGTAPLDQMVEIARRAQTGDRGANVAASKIVRTITGASGGQAPTRVAGEEPQATTTQGPQAPGTFPAPMRARRGGRRRGYGVAGRPRRAQAGGRAGVPFGTYGYPLGSTVRADAGGLLDSNDAAAMDTINSSLPVEGSPRIGMRYGPGQGGANIDINRYINPSEPMAPPQDRQAHSNINLLHVAKLAAGLMPSAAGGIANLGPLAGG